MEAPEENKLRTALHPENFRIVCVSIVTKEDNRGGVFGLSDRIHESVIAEFQTCTGVSSNTRASALARFRSSRRSA